MTVVMMCIFFGLKAILITIKHITIQSDHFEGGKSEYETNQVVESEVDEYPNNCKGKTVKFIVNYVENNSK